MKTATCALVADTSKFDGPIDRAKAKLSAFGQAVSSVMSGVERAANVFNTLVSVADGIDKIKNAFNTLREASNSAINAIKNFPVLLDKVRSFGASALGVLKNIHPAIIAVGAGTLIATGAVYGMIKAFQGIVAVSRSVLTSLKDMAVAMASVTARTATSIGSGLVNAFRGLGSVVKSAGIALGGMGISLGALDRFFKIGITSAIELGDSMKNLSARTGASIPFLVDMQKLFKNSGISADYAGNAMLNMQRALSGINADGEPTNDMFRRLNLNVEDLMQMSPENAFKAIGTAIAGLGTESEKTAAAFAIFGRQGGGLKAVFKDPAFATLGTNLSNLGVSLEKNADNFSKISAKLRDSGSFFRGFFVEMAGAVAPSILGLFKLFEGGDMLSGFGKRLGDQIATAINALVGAFKGGQLISILKLTFETAVIILKDLLARAFEYASDVFQAFMGSSAIPKIGDALTNVFSLSVKGLVQMLLGGFSEGISTLQAGIQIVVEDMASRLDGVFGKFINIGKEFLKGGGGLTGALSAFGKAGDLLTQTGQGISGERAAQILQERQAQGGQFFGIDLNAKAFAETLKGISQEVANAIGATKDGFMEVQEVLKRFPPESKEAQDALKRLSSEVNKLAEAGKPAQQAVEDVAGGASLLAPRPRAGAGGRGIDSAVSSLQRIGGGGGAFGGDPILKNAEKQTSLQEKMVQELQKQNKMAEKGVGLEAGGFSYAVLA